jgi:hypothetical protein
MMHARIVPIRHELAVHVTSEASHSVELGMVEHLAEFLKLVFRLLFAHSAFLFRLHALKGVEVGAILDQSTYIYLRTDVIA